MQRTQAEDNQSKKYDLQHAPSQGRKVHPAGSGHAVNQLPGDVGDAKTHQIGGQNGQQDQWVMTWQYEWDTPISSSKRWGAMAWLIEPMVLAPVFHNTWYWQNTGALIMLWPPTARGSAVRCMIPVHVISAVTAVRTRQNKKGRPPFVLTNGGRPLFNTV